MWVLKNGDLDEVKDYVVKGEDVNWILEGGRKFFYYVVDCGQFEILEFLLLKGVDINVLDKYYIIFFLFVVYEGYVFCVKLFLLKGVDKIVKGLDGLIVFEVIDNQVIKVFFQ